MSFPGEIQFSSGRAYVDLLSDVQYADFSKVAVADFSKVQYFQPSDSEDDEAVEEGKLSSHQLCLSYERADMKD
jgi:hypothetical protein